MGGFAGHTTGWTEDRVETLKRLWAEGLSANQIAGELGGVTRNGVIGKIHRLGLSGRTKAPSQRAPRKPRVPRLRRQPQGTFAYQAEPDPEYVEPVEQKEIPAEQRKTLLELNGHTCRWPIGDPATPEFFFCGGEPSTGFPYCQYHSSVAFQPHYHRGRGRPPRWKDAV